MDFELARANMIEQQIRPWNVLEMQTLNALGAIRREDFVPEAYRDLAFADVQIPLGDGEVMLEPKVSARMMESLHLGGNDRVLEIGTGSGYLSALLSQVCEKVTSIEINADFIAMAERNLGMAGINNVEIVEADGHDSWGDDGTFDAILISGSLAEIGPHWCDKLKPAGRLIGIEGMSPAMHAVLLTKTADSIVRKSLFETWAPRLKNAEDTPEFVF